MGMRYAGGGIGHTIHYEVSSGVEQDEAEIYEGGQEPGAETGSEDEISVCEDSNEEDNDGWDEGFESP